MDFLYFILGSVFIFFGSTLLINNSTLIARSLRISPLVVGLTIIAFGTSLPELVVSVMASIKGEGSIVLGNVVGSNIANVSLVLPIILLLKPIKVQIDSIKQGLIYLFLSKRRRRRRKNRVFEVMDTFLASKKRYRYILETGIQKLV